MRTGFLLRCPRCGRGKLFRGLFTMEPECRICHLRVEREPGYFVGAIYLNYGATVFLALGGSFALDAVSEARTSTQLAVWLPFTVLFPLVFFRYSKSLWLSFEYFVNPEPRPSLRRVR